MMHGVVDLEEDGVSVDSIVESGSFDHVGHRLTDPGERNLDVRLGQFLELLQGGRVDIGDAFGVDHERGRRRF